MPSPGISRPLATPIPAAQTTTRFLSVLLRQQNTSGVFNGFFGVYLDGGGINDDDVFIGKPGGGQLNRWVVGNARRRRSGGRRPIP